MSSSQGDKKDSDVEMGEATSPAPVLTSLAEAPACVAGHLSFREELVRRQAEKELAQAGSVFRLLPRRSLPRVMGPKSWLFSRKPYLQDLPRLRSSSRTRRRPLTLCLLLQPEKTSFWHCVLLALSWLLSLRVGRGNLPRVVTGRIRSEADRA